MELRVDGSATISVPGWLGDESDTFDGRWTYAKDWDSVHLYAFDHSQSEYIEPLGELTIGMDDGDLLVPFFNYGRLRLRRDE